MFDSELCKLLSLLNVADCIHNRSHLRLKIGASHVPHVPPMGYSLGNHKSQPSFTMLPYTFGLFRILTSISSCSTRSFRTDYHLPQPPCLSSLVWITSVLGARTGTIYERLSSFTPTTQTLLTKGFASSLNLGYLSMGNHKW